jgi:putative PIN family toxin of toxin-antitoxin system
VRLVLDTNIVVSGLLWESGPPARLIEAANAQRLELYTSTALLEELRRILSRRKFSPFVGASPLSVDELVLGYAAIATVIVPAAITPVITRDPDDDHVLACALAANADLIVSGDHDLLNLKTYRDIPITRASEALRRAALA